MCPNTIYLKYLTLTLHSADGICTPINNGY